GLSGGSSSVVSSGISGVNRVSGASRSHHSHHNHHAHRHHGYRHHGHHHGKHGHHRNLRGYGNQTWGNVPNNFTHRGFRANYNTPYYWGGYRQQTAPYGFPSTYQAP